MGQYLNELYAQNFTLQCENKALRRTIDEFKSGKRYRKLQDGHERVVAGYKQENRRLTRELAAARETTRRVRNTWFEQCDTDFDWYQEELAKYRNFDQPDAVLKEEKNSEHPDPIRKTEGRSGGT